MNKNKKSVKKDLSDSAGLRRDAAKKDASKSPVIEVFGGDLSGQRHLQEMEVHRHELEMQNDELKRVQAELDVSIARYRRITEGLTDYLYTVRIENGCAVETTQGLACEKVTGYTPEEFSVNPYLWIQMVAPEDRELVRDRVQQLLNGVEIPPIEHRIIRKNGDLCWIRDTTILFKDDSGNLLSYDGLIQDITDRKDAEELLSESEERLREVIDQTPAGYFLIDRSGCFKSVNSAWLHMHGYESEDEVIGKQFCMTQVEGDRQLAEQYVEKIISGEPVSGSEFTRLCKDGSIAYHTFSARAVVHRGEIAGIEGFIIDNTEHRRIEDVRTFLAQTSSRTQNEPFFNALARYLAQSLGLDFICIDSLEGDGLTARTVAVWCDGHFEDNVTYALKDTPCGEVVGKTVCCFPDSICQLFPRDQVLQDLRAESYVGVTLFGHDGQPVGLIAGIGRNPLTNRSQAESTMRLVAVRAAGEMERLEAEESLRKSEENYRTLFSEMLDGFALHEIICDADGEPADYRFLAINPAFERLTGLKKEDLIGRTVLEVMPDTERQWIDIYGKVALTGEPAFFNNYSAGLNKHFEVTAFRPAPNQFACIFSDITERKQAELEKNRLETQLQQAQKMESVGRLAGGVAHDFNNMLTVILGHAELALMKIDPTQPLFADMEQIHKSAERSASLTRQLLAFARKQVISPIVLDLNESVAGVLKMLQRLIGECIHLTWRPAANLWNVKMDPSQIDQILANLCVNARDSIVDVGDIIIETGNCSLDKEYCAQNLGFVPGDYLRLSVSDNGSGMDKETIEHIFEPFFTTKRMGEGTGLGLATVYGIVKQNNGFINVYSEPGCGTTFTIYLPRHEPNDGHVRSAGDSRQVSRGHETILLVEDEPAILKLTTEILGIQGYTVMPTSVPAEAIRIASEHVGEIHMIMTDVVMPEMNGRDLAKKLQSLYPQLKCLFMSGYTADVIAHYGVLDEDVHFIQKPFSMRDLSIKVREILDCGKG